MADKTKIQWTDRTWNPVTGCTKISPGCLNCYIERTPPFRIAGRKFEHGKIPLQFHADRLNQPDTWKKPQMVFVNSLSDLFHQDVPFEFIDQVFATMVRNPRHVFQVLTKRPQRFIEWVESRSVSSRIPKHIWCGVSVENQKAMGRISILNSLPCETRFVSFEPLLEPISIGLGTFVDWAIIGGESGPHSRPCDIQWITKLADDLAMLSIPTFIKQLGSNALFDGAPKSFADKKGGDPEEWPVRLRVREFPHYFKGFGGEQ